MLDFDRWFMQSSAFKFENQEMQLIFISWINLWCGSFKYQHDIEQKFRLNQLIQVLQKMKEPISNGQPINLAEIQFFLITTLTSYSNYSQAFFVHDSFTKIFSFTKIDHRVNQMLAAQKNAEYNQNNKDSKRESVTLK